MSYTTPILVIAWRRPHTLRQVINAIRPISPSRLYVACDGPSPRRGGESVQVAATRAVIENEIDWPCEIFRFYSEVNQGCRLGVTRAITWFFEQVEEGIILEDDCVPHIDFFRYCTTLLDRYRYDTRVWCISGNNFQNGQWRGDGSYYFSRYNHCWGWASWRRCWQHYDGGLELWPALKNSDLLKSVFPDSVERRYWTRIWQRLLSKGQPDTWDYQWFFTLQINEALTALPNVNLVQNVGFGQDATHTTGSASRGLVTTLGHGLGEIAHPGFLVRCVEADRFTFDHHYEGKYCRFPWVQLRFPLRLAACFYRRLSVFMFSALKWFSVGLDSA